MDNLIKIEDRGSSPLTIEKVYESSKDLEDISRRKEFVKTLIDLMNLILPDHKIEESTYHDPEQMLEKIGPSIETYLQDIKEIGEAQLVIYCFDGQHRLLFCTDNDFPEKDGLTLGHSDNPDPDVQKRFDSLNLTKDHLKSSANS